jgi:hypothetical protein
MYGIERTPKRVAIAHSGTILEYMFYARQRTEPGIGVAEDRSMNMQADTPQLPWLLLGFSATILLGALALGSVVDGPVAQVVATAAPVPEARLTRIQRVMCDECGVVAATRRIARSDGEKMTAAATQYEVTVRMRDGSIRTFIETSSVHWRSGERITLIEGADQ